MIDKLKQLKRKLEQRLVRLDEFNLPEIPHQKAEINWILQEVNKIIENK